MHLVRELAITGFNNLAYHTFNKEETDDMTCRLCFREREEFVHLAENCTRLINLRVECFGVWGPGEKWDMEGLLKFIRNPVVSFLLDNRPGNPDDVIHF